MTWMLVVKNDALFGIVFPISILWASAWSVCEFDADML